METKFTAKNSLIGKKVKVISDNDCYNSFRNKTLIITSAERSGLGYDKSVYPELLCCLRDLKGNDIPCALYEYEFRVIN